MISLDYDDTLMAAAGHQAEEALEQTIAKYKGNYILAVRRQSAARRRRHLLHPGRQALRREAQARRQGREGDHLLGLVRLVGLRAGREAQSDTGNSVHKVIFDKPIIKVPGCPPIAEVMTGVVTYVLTFDRLPEMDAQGRPKMFYSVRVHDKCYRRPNFDAGQFVEKFDDAGARQGYCLYKVGCKGPVTYNACSATRWNEGLSFPIQSGHGCIGCSEDDFWDKGSFYDHLTTIRPPGVAGVGIEGTATRLRCRRARGHRRGAGGARRRQRDQAGAQFRAQ